MKKVRCATDDLIFDSVSDAAKYYNLTYGQVYKSIRGFYKGGNKYFHWDLGKEFAKSFDRRTERLEQTREVKKKLVRERKPWWWKDE